MSEKKLPDLKQIIEDNPPVKPIPVLLRTNKEILAWLEKIFELRSDEKIEMSFASIAEELTMFLERDVNPRQIGEAYKEWQRKNKS